MRKPSTDTRIVTYVGSEAGFRHTFDELLEQLVNAGLYDIRYRTANVFRIWVTKPADRQVIFVPQSDYQVIRGLSSPIIAIQQVESFLKTGGATGDKS